MAPVSSNKQNRQRVTEGGMHEGHTSGPHRVLVCEPEAARLGIREERLTSEV